MRSHPKASAFVLIATALALTVQCTRADSWVTNTPMLTQRAFATATLLANGRIIMAGGTNGSGVLGNSEIYTLSNHVWSPGPTLATARYRHTATLMANGSVLVAGGNPSGVTTPTAELYTVANVWAATGSMANSRSGHAAVLLHSGKIMVIGGYNATVNYLNSCELYDPNLGGWGPTGSLNVRRLYCSATLLSNGCVLVAGGQTNSTTWTATAEIYDPTTAVWTNIAPMASARAGHAAVLLPNGKVLVAGGLPCNACSALTNAELFDPATSTWTNTGSMTVPRYDNAHLAATVLPNGQVLVAGGDGGGSPYATAELYNPITETWTAATPMNQARDSFTTTLVGSSNAVLVAGGRLLSSTEFYEADATLAINLSQNQFAQLKITSPAGSMHQVEYVTNLTSTNWTALFNLALPTNPYTYTDYSSTNDLQRFYRDQP